LEELRLLRKDIDRGLDSLDAGKGRSVDIGDVLSRMPRLKPPMAATPQKA
jgi:hypothetical protein